MLKAPMTALCFLTPDMISPKSCFHPLPFAVGGIDSISSAQGCLGSVVLVFLEKLFMLKCYDQFSGKCSNL
jgi:hypothetical protein